MANQNNPTASSAAEVIKKLEDILVPIAQKAIIAAVPELGLPIVEQITQAIEQSLADKLTQMAETGVIFAIIDYQTFTENVSMAEAISALQAAIKSGDPNAIQKAKAQFDAAQDALATDDGSGSVQ